MYIKEAMSLWNEANKEGYPPQTCSYFYQIKSAIEKRQKSILILDGRSVKDITLKYLEQQGFKVEWIGEMLKIWGWTEESDEKEDPYLTQAQSLIS